MFKDHWGHLRKLDWGNVMAFLAAGTVNMLGLGAGLYFVSQASFWVLDLLWHRPSPG